MSHRWRLILAAVALISWLLYLGYAALTKSRGPILSQAQIAAASHAIVAEVRAGPDGKPEKRVKVDETLSPGKGPKKGTEIEIENLYGAHGFTGPGQYLLLLTDSANLIVGQQRSPGNDLGGAGPPLIYRWSDDVRKQYERIPARPEPSH
jgi:hypothetical protein